MKDTLNTAESSNDVKPKLNDGFKLKIELKDWDHTCGDGCCYTYGTDIFLNGEKLDEQHGEDSENALKVVLEKLGYEVEIIKS